MILKNILLAILTLMISSEISLGQNNVLELINKKGVTENSNYRGNDKSASITLNTYITDTKIGDTLYTHYLLITLLNLEYPAHTKIDLTKKDQHVSSVYTFIDQKNINSMTAIRDFDGFIEILEHTDSTLRLSFDIELINTQREKLKQFYKGERTFENSNAQPTTIVDSATNNYFVLDKTHNIVTAFDKTNKLLWQTNPRDSFPLSLDKFHNYRTNCPIITYFKIGLLTRGSDVQRGQNVIHICYNNSQFGFIDMKTGRFQYSGQD